MLRSPTAIRRTVLLAAAHGMTDVAVVTSAPACLLPYVTIMLPLPGWLTTAAFSCASILHFGEDIGVRCSATMHALLTVAAFVNRDASFLAMSVYFCFVHTPMHYMRLLCTGQRAAVAVALVITAVMALLSCVPVLSERTIQLLPKSARLLTPYEDAFKDVAASDRVGGIHVTHAMQKLVVAHVLVETLQAGVLGGVESPARICTFLSSVLSSASAAAGAISAAAAWAVVGLTRDTTVR